jgi:hypothetical protein
VSYRVNDPVRVLTDVPEGIEVSFYKVEAVDGNEITLSRDGAQDLTVTVDRDGVGVLDERSIVEPDTWNLHNEYDQGAVIAPEQDYDFDFDLSTDRGEANGNAL